MSQLEKLSKLLSKIAIQLASLGGFEPTTHCLEGSCSIRLSYRDT